MRIWSLHPSLLDRMALVSCWRETLLAKAVLENKTKGYKNHPQLIRFRERGGNPLDYINQYLLSLVDEATHRDYKFDYTKICYFPNMGLEPKILVTLDQVAFELEHLKKKVMVRNKDWYENRLKNVRFAEVNPIFAPIRGDIESWEKI